MERGWIGRDQGPGTRVSPRGASCPAELRGQALCGRQGQESRPGGGAVGGIATRWAGGLPGMAPVPANSARRRGSPQVNSV